MAALTTTSVTIEIGDASIYLAANDNGKGNLFGNRLANPTSAVLIAIVTDALRWQLDTNPPITAVNATGTITVTAIGTDGDSIEVFVNDPILGLISLGVYVKLSSDTTVTILAASITTELNLNAYGYTATSALGVITITARPGLGATINGGLNLSVTITPAVVPVTGLYGWWISTEGVTDPTSISSWADQSGNGNDLVQATSNRQPRIITGFNSFDALALKAGTNMQARLKTANVIGAITGFTSFIVASQTSNANGADSDGTFIGFSDTYLQRTSTNNSVSAILGGSAITVSGLSDGTVYTIRTVSDGVDSSITVDNSIQSTMSNSPAFGNTEFYVFQNQSSSNSGNKNIYEILLYTRVLTAPEITQVEEYLQNKYNHY